MLNEFMDKIVSNGAQSVLPQNLPEKWFEILFKTAKAFLKNAAEQTGVSESKDEKDIFDTEESMILLAAVMEILQYRYNYPAEFDITSLEEGELYESMSCYALSIIIEFIGRKSDFIFEKPTLDTIFDQERIFEIEEKNEDLTRALNLLISGQ